MLSQSDRFQYFRSFVISKIDRGGVKQNAIADYIGKSPTYIHKLYKGGSKSCPDDVQDKVAEFFGISIEKLIEKGKFIYHAKNNVGKQQPKEQILDNFIEKRSQEPIELKKQLVFIGQGIEKLNNEKEELKKRIELCSLIFKELGEGITFFDDKRQFVFSSNRWGLLKGIDPRKTLSIDSIMLVTRKKIKNFDEVSDILLRAYDHQKKDTARVELIDKTVFLFKILPIYDKNKEFQGMLLINTMSEKKFSEKTEPPRG